MSEAERRARRLFAIAALALFTAGLSFSLRAAVIADVEREILAALDPAHSAARAGRLLGDAFLGFALTLALGSALLEWIGMGRALLACALAFALGTAAVVLADSYGMLRLGFLVCGLGWGFMEATVNPLVAALYPTDKTRRLNLVHAWWPAGLIAGGTLGALGATLALGWRGQIACVIAPALGCAALCLRSRFPRTERASAGYAWGEMFGELGRRPMFWVWWGCMFLTAASELAPGQWIDLTLTRTVGMRGIWLLVYVSGMMFGLRHFAGPIAHRLSNVGMLWGSVVLASVGLVLLPRASTPFGGLAAATVWGLGVCFLWPTMLANVAERYPRGGELFIGLLGVAGALAIQFVLPELGAIFDRERLALAGGAEALGLLHGEALDAVLRGAAQKSFETLALLPTILIAVFGAIWAWDRSRAAAQARDSSAASVPPRSR
jgi:predicted MFS family arabinose efflux permease